MKRHRTGFLVLMLMIAFALVFNSCDKNDVIDSGGDVELTFSPNLILSNDGGTTTVDLNLGNETVWQVETRGEDTGWCEVTPASGKGGGKFVIITGANPKRAERRLELLVTAGQTSQTMTVYQKDTLGVKAPDNLVVSNDGDTLVISVEANTAWEVIKPDYLARWATFTPSHGEGKGEVMLVIGSNTLLRARSVEFVFSAGSVNRVITVSQQDMTPTSSTDSLALVALYQATGGAYWSSPWDLTKGIATWQGVTTAMQNGELRVTRLSLTSRGIDGVLPPEIGNLSYLERLDISYNNIHGEIPDEIGNFTHLKDLNITSNKFDGDIPASIRNLSELESLDAQQNRFKLFPVEICQLANLTYLHLGHNEILSLPGKITEMSGLEYLYLDNNQLTALPAGLDQLPNLIYLHASNNRITEFPSEIGQLTHLVSLRLDHNEMTGTIPAGLSNLVRLKYLYLSENHFTDASLPEDMDRMEALESIEAYNCGLAGPIPEFGKNGAFVNLKTVWMSGNRLNGHLPASLPKLTQLTQLYLDGNELNGTLGEVDWSKMRTLASLALSGNQFSGKIPVAIGDLINLYWPGLQSVFLNNNYLEGPVPKSFDGMRNISLNYAKNIYPQRDGVTLVMEK